VNIGKYEVIDLIGEGGMSTVFRGRDPRIGRDVAIKVLKTSKSTDDLDLATRFSHEARITGQLVHPSIVTIFDFDITPENQTYIVMELIDGRSASRHLGKLTAGQFERIVRGVASGLDYAHSKRVIHRDIKPSNLMITATSDVKILDFGIARMIAASESSAGLTRSGMVVGTPAYLAPEQVSGAPITPSVDQFALAVVAFELLTGKKPFGGETIHEQMTAILMQQPSDALALNPTLGSACVAVLQKALAKKPLDRFGTCSEFVESLLNSLNSTAGWRPFLTETPLPSPAAPSVQNSILHPEQITTRIDLPLTVGLSKLEGQQAPSNFSFTQAVAVAGPYFGSGQAHFQEIKNSLSFYQDQLQQEYDVLIKQMRTTYILWLVTVSMSFLVLLVGVVLFLMHQIAGGAITTISSAMLYFLQRVFQQREDAYRSAADAKRNNVEYGNQWALVIQTIQGMEDPKERVMREGELVKALTDRLRARDSKALPQKGRRTPLGSSN